MRRHRHLREDEHRQQAERAYARHGLPDRRHAVGERGAHGGAQRLRQPADDRDRGVRDLDAAGELRDEVRGELLLERVLEDRRGDGDPPRLREGAHEGEERERGRGAVDGQRREDREDRRGVLARGQCCARGAGAGTYEEADAGGDDDLVADPLRGGRVRLEERRDAEADRDEDPAREVERAVFLRDLDEGAGGQGEERDDQRDGQLVDAGAGGRGPEDRLEVDGEVI